MNRTNPHSSETIERKPAQPAVDELRELAGALESLEVRIDTLEARLTLVLGPARPMPSAPPNETSAPEQESSPLTSELRAARRRVKRLSEHLDAILVRTEV